MRNLVLPLVALTTVFSPVLLAQSGRHIFDLDSMASSFTFSGTVNGLAIVGNPATVNLSGSLAAQVDTTGATITSAQLLTTAQDTVVLPTLNANVPNPIPIFPPLATITGTNIVLTFRSTDAMGNPAPFAVSAGGAFSTNIVTEAISGTIVATGLVNQTVDITGTVSDPQPISGTLTAGADGFDVTVPVNSTFNFVFSPLTAMLTLNGQIQGSDRALASTPDNLTAGTGGTQSMTLSAGTADAGNAYLIIASASGTAPGFPIPGGGTLPLNFDSLSFDSVNLANMVFWGNNLGFVDAAGRGHATFTLPPLPPLFGTLGLHFFHAGIVVDAGGTITEITNPVEVGLY